MERELTTLLMGLREDMGRLEAKVDRLLNSRSEEQAVISNVIEGVRAPVFFGQVPHQIPGFPDEDESYGEYYPEGA